MTWDCAWLASCVWHLEWQDYSGQKSLMPFFEVLMFPWVASYRGIRANSIAAIGLSVLLFARLLTGIR